MVLWYSVVGIYHYLSILLPTGIWIASRSLAIMNNSAKNSFEYAFCAGTCAFLSSTYLGVAAGSWGMCMVSFSINHFILLKSRKPLEVI